MFKTAFSAFALTLTAVSCGPSPVAHTGAGMEVAPAPTFELEMRRASYGISLRDPADPEARLGRRFERACEARGESFYSGLSLKPRPSLREWREQNPAFRLILSSVDGYTQTQDGIIVGRSEDGSFGPWTRVTVILTCQFAR